MLEQAAQRAWEIFILESFLDKAVLRYVWPDLVLAKVNFVWETPPKVPYKQHFYVPVILGIQSSEAQHLFSFKRACFLPTGGDVMSPCPQFSTENLFGIDGQQKLWTVFAVMASEKIYMKYSRIFWYNRSKLFSQWLGPKKAKHLFVFIDIHTKVVSFTSSAMRTSKLPSA